MTPQERKLVGRIAALKMHAAGRTNTAPAREAFLSRWGREVDPEGLLSPEERERRASFARRAYFAELALQSARTRARRKQKAGPATELPGPTLEVAGASGRAPS